MGYGYMQERARVACGAFALASAMIGCSGTDGVFFDNRAPGANSPDPSPSDAGAPLTADGSVDAAPAPAEDASFADDGSADSFDSGSAPIDAAPPAPPSAQDLAALTAKCVVASNGKYSPHTGLPATVDVCRLNGAFFWTSEMRIDCDGQSSPQCRKAPYFSNQTAFTQSNGKPLDAARLPYVTLPDPSSKFSYINAGIQPGAVAVVLYGGKMAYGVFGDTGPSDMIGEASYAMASALGIDPNPSNGGVGGGVTYILFTGQAAVASPIEDPLAAQKLGQTLVTALVKNN
jgi:hypothetical protein